MTAIATGHVLSREWRLVHYLNGQPNDTDVELVTVEVDEPDPGFVRVENEVMSVEPYMRGRMSSRSTYADPYVLGEAMRAPAIGRVTASSSVEIPVGATVLHDFGWREHALVPETACTVVHGQASVSALHLGLLGIPGMTAWVGVRRIAQLKSGDVVFVSSAAGAVGSTVVQIAKALGCTVIGSAGSKDKVALVRELGADAAFDYHDGSVGTLLRGALAELGAPGLDAYFDNVGGDHLEAAIRVLNDHARVALCGMISIYSAESPQPGPSNLIKLVWRRARMEGFLLRDHRDARPEFEADMREWLHVGAVRAVETAVPGGIEGAWAGFLGMLDGTGTGKTIVPL
ncbi:NADP-dependent oxidoreductase [Rhodococcus sp. ARC_M6]|uniref:NADP-dependent oxidoreductase n=1 Tax=Rhodococcus sp. ARC_M6 TaxID=2928852 RepID=UPI001FB48D95|nr:NADP-dependent oxidoreductase [Rhodococcus sp. ARC_M6]MCJ0905441.1 NADP-dependent oxidoreductase [Rhodococcus sp. ARC_M6]